MVLKRKPWNRKLKKNDKRRSQAIIQQGNLVYFLLPSLIFLDAFKYSATSKVASRSILSKNCFLLSPGICWNFVIPNQKRESLIFNSKCCYMLQKQTLTVHFYLSTHPSQIFVFNLPWAGLEPTSPWLLVGHAKPLHHQGYHAGNAADNEVT